MFSGDESEREKNVERIKYCSGAQALLGAGLLGCAITAVIKQDDYYLSYYVGGFTCGIMVNLLVYLFITSSILPSTVNFGMIAGSIGVYSYHKASSYSGNDTVELQRQVRCPLLIQKILGYVLFFMSISGIMMTIIFLVGYDSKEYGTRLHMVLAVCILAGIVLLLVATFLSLLSVGDACCNAGYNQRMHQTYPSTGTTTFSYQSSTVQTAGLQPVFNTRGINAQSNSPYPISQFQSSQQPLYGFQPNGFAPQQPTGPPPAYPY